MLLLRPSRNFGTLNIWDFWLLHSLRNVTLSSTIFASTKGNAGRVKPDGCPLHPAVTVVEFLDDSFGNSRAMGWAIE